MLFPCSLLQADDFKIFLEKTRNKYNLPALGGTATLNGRIVRAEVSGFRKFRSGVATTLNDKFHIGSCTKSMTFFFAQVLVDQKKIKWDSTLYDTFPRYHKVMHRDLQNITLKHLLSHTAGLPSLPLHQKNLWLELFMNRLEKPAQKQREKIISKVLPLPPIHKPGTKFLYSNCSVSIAGMMLEKAANMSWKELVYKYIATPLGMKSISLNDAATTLKVDQSFPHIQRDNKTIYIDPRTRPDNPAAIAPAGTVHLSLPDIAKYTTIFSLQDNNLLSSTSKKIITTAVLGSYALCWVTLKRKWGGNILMHNGSNKMNQAVM